jgi:hypothetical protein
MFTVKAPYGVIDCKRVQSEMEGVPDNTRPPRRLQDPDPRPTLIVRAIMTGVEELAHARGLKSARVAYKRNAQGEHVVALIFPELPP